MTRTVLLSLTLCSAVAADEASDAAARLQSRGARSKKDRSGAIVELGIDGKVAMTADDYRSVGSLKTVRKLSLSASELPLNDETLAAVGAMESVEHFFSNGATLTDDGLKGFAGWKNLRHLGFDHWGWKGRGDSKDLVGPGLAHLAACPNLESIRLGGCKIDDNAAPALAKIKTLQRLDLFHAKGITDAGLPALAALPNLRYLRLAPQFTPRITDAGLEHLAKFPALEELEIGETVLTYENGLSHLKGLATLRKLKLDKVVIAEEDLARAKAELLTAVIEWTPPDKAAAERARAGFDRARTKAAKKGR